MGLLILVPPKFEVKKADMGELVAQKRWEK